MIRSRSRFKNLTILIYAFTIGPAIAQERHTIPDLEACSKSVFSIFSIFYESSIAQRERNQGCSPEALAIYSATKLDETYNEDSISDSEFRGSLQHGPQPQPSLAPSMNTGAATFGLPPRASKPENDRKIEKLPGHSNLSK